MGVPTELRLYNLLLFGTNRLLASGGEEEDEDDDEEDDTDVGVLGGDAGDEAALELFELDVMAAVWTVPTGLSPTDEVIMGDLRVSV